MGSEPIVSHPAPPPSEERLARVGAGPIERLSLSVLLKDVTLRLGAIEETLAKRSSADSRMRPLALELSRVIFGGWPALGFLFLLLFYAPLRDALASIPDKVRSAEEIQLGNMSLKSTIKAVAATQGLGALGEKIPELSSAAIELLLRAPRGNVESLWSYSVSNNNRITTFYLPTEAEIQALAELQQTGLVRLEGGMEGSRVLQGKDLDRLLNDVRERFPGVTKPDIVAHRFKWALKNEIPKEVPLVMTWALTDSGKQAVDVVLKAVSRALAGGSGTEFK
jgi:hypothetical protein